MEINLKLDSEDWKNTQAYICGDLELKTESFGGAFFGSMLLWMALGAIAMFIYRQFYDTLHWPSTIFSALLLFAIYLMDIIKGIYGSEKSKVPASDSMYYEQSKYRFDDSRFTVESDGAKSYLSWKNVKKIDNHNDFIYIFIDKGLAITLPKNKIHEFDELYKYVCEKFNSYKSLNMDTTSVAPIS